MFNHERCSLSGSTVYPGARFGVSLKLLYPETDLVAEKLGGGGSGLDYVILLSEGGLGLDYG